MQHKSERLFLTLPADLDAQMAELGRTLGVESKPELVRILLRQSLAAVPWDSPMLADMREGLNSARQWAFAKLREKFAEIEQEMGGST